MCGFVAINGEDPITAQGLIDEINHHQNMWGNQSSVPTGAEG